MPYCKFYKEKEQVSYDGGQTWNDIPGTDRKGNIYEYDSPDCGSPQSFFPKWIAHYWNGYIISAACDSTSAITQNEIPSYASYSETTGPNSLTILEIGDCVTTIDNSACANYQIMSIVTIPNSVTTIGSKAFYRCDHIGNIVIPNSVTTIGSESFWCCSGATSLTIGSGVTTIGSTAFQYCNKIRNIVIPDSVITIGYAAFKDCSGLTSCTIGSGVTSIDSSAFQNCGCLTSIDIPDNVTYIGGGTFGNCSGLTSCTIGSGVTEIVLDTFSNCYKLTGITIPDTVTSIGSWAFTNCRSMQSCTIGSGVTSISTNAFSNCASLTSITIEATTPPTLGSNVFTGTPISRRLGVIYVPCQSINAYKTASGWSEFADGITCSEMPISYQVNLTLNDSTTIDGCWCDSNGVLRIPEPFIDKSKIVSAEIFRCVTTIGSNAFEYCSGLTSVSIPDTVTTIDNWAFGRCTSITGVTIPSSVTTINNNVFNYCTGLASITIEATTPPALGYASFDNTNNCPIYVPASSVTAYKSASVWSNYANRIQAIP